MKKTLIVIFCLIYIVILPLNHSIIINVRNDHWPMFRHDSEHTGYTISDAPDTNNTLWNFLTVDIVSSSPAVLNDRLYVGSSDKKLYCLNISTGESIWNFTTGNNI